MPKTRIRKKRRTQIRVNKSRRNAKRNNTQIVRTVKSVSKGGSAPPLTKAAVEELRRNTTLSLNNKRVEPLKNEIDAVKNAVGEAATAFKNEGVAAVSTGIKHGLSTMGVNVNDPNKLQSQITGFKDVLSSDETQQAAISISKDMGKIGIEVATSLMPLATPLIDESIKVVSAGAEKAVDSIVNTGKYSISSVLGPFAAVPFAIASVVDAGVAISDTGTKLATATADTIHAVTNISNKVLKEQQSTLDRISKTTDDFLTNSSNPIQVPTVIPKVNNALPKVIPKVNNVLPKVNKGGGKSRRRPTRRPTRRVRDSGKKTRSCLKNTLNTASRHSAGTRHTRKSVSFNKVLEFNNNSI
jgi:hypothetical protein